MGHEQVGFLHKSSGGDRRTRRARGGLGGSPIDAVLLPFRGQKYESPGENVRVHATNTYLHNNRRTT